LGVPPPPPKAFARAPLLVATSRFSGFRRWTRRHSQATRAGVRQR
jgi:hypothetical protein